MRQSESTKLGTVKNLNRRVRHLMLAATVAGLGGKSAMATSAWTGPGGSTAAPTTGTWSTGTNWSPGLPTSGASTELDFLGGSTAYTATDDITGAFNLNILKINSSGGTIAASGTNSLAFNGSSPLIQQVGVGTFTIAAPVTLTASTSISQVNSGEIDFTGAVGGSFGLTLSNISGSPTNSVVKFTGSNAFNGLTVNAHVTAISGLSSSATTLGSGVVTLNGGTLQLQGRQSGSSTPADEALGLTGFDGDTIADAAAGSAATASSTGTAFTGIDGPSHVLYQNYTSANNQGGLPYSGIINSAYNGSAAALNGSKTSFILGYNGSSSVLTKDNVLYFPSGNTSSQSLTLTAPVKTTALQVLAGSQNVSAFNVKLTFSDNSTSNYSSAVTTGVWATFGSSSNNVANQAFLGQNVLAIGSGPLNWDPQLTESDITLSAADAAKTITSISFAPTSTGFGYSSEIYAIDGDVEGTVATLAGQTYANAVNVTADSSIDVSGSLIATMGNLTIGGNKLSITSSDTTASPYSLTLGATTLTGSSATTFNVASSSGGGAGTLSLGALNDGGTARTITFNPTGTGTVVLSANATSLVQGTAINIQGGTVNSSTGTAIGSLTTVTLSSPGTFLVGASQTVSALNGSAGSVSLGGNTLTVGSTDNLNSTFGGVVSGTGVLTKAGTGTLTLSGQNTVGGSNINSNGANIPTSVNINAGTVVANGSTTISGGGIASGPLGTTSVLVNSGTSLLLGNTPGINVANPLYGTSSGSTPSTFGGLNTTGVTTFSGNITLGTGSSGDNSHNAIVGATAGGEVDFTGNILANSTGNLSSVTVNNLTGSGSATVKFTGSNTYNGGTTINPNVTLAVGGSTSTTPLGTAGVTLAGGKLALQGVLPSGVQQTVGVTGYNANTILDAAATNGANTSTGTPTSFIGSGLVYFENGYQGNSTNGLPTSGIVPSLATGHNFQLAAYTDLNTLRYTSPGESHTLSLASPGSFQTLDFLAIGGGGTSNFTVTLNFSDSSTDSIGGFTAANWYSGGNAFKGLDPAQQDNGGNPSTTIYDGVHDTNDNPQQNYGGNLSIGEYDINVPIADQGKTITGITLVSTAVNGNSAEVYAVDGATAVGNTPLANQTYSNNLNITANSGIDVSGSLNASIGTITIGTSKLTLTSADTSGSPYSLTTGQANFAATGATFDVENSAGGGAGTLILGSINDGGAAQNLVKLGPGTLALNSPATRISAPSVYNIEAGTLAANDPNAMNYSNGTTTYNVAITIASGATFSLGANQTVESISDFGSPAVNSSYVVLNGNTLTLGARDQGGTFSGVISDGTGSTGSGGLVKSGAGTVTLNGASTYSGPTTVGFGTLVVANTTGSATGSGDVTLGNTSNATLASGAVGSIAGNLIAGQLSNIYPGGNGSIGSLTLGGLTTGFNTKIGFDLGSGSGIITNGDLITLGAATVNIAPDTVLALSSSPTTPADYRLFGGSIGGITLSNFILPTPPSGTSYTLSTSVDSGYIDLVVAAASSGPNNLVWNNSLSSTGDGTSWANTTGSPDSAQNWINTASSAASGFTSGDNVTFNDSNNGHYTVNLTSNVLPTSITVSSSGIYTIQSTGGYVIGDVPGGSTTLTQSGGGTLNITNVNTFTGATNISGSGTTLHLTSTGALATGSLSVGTGSVVNLDGVLTGTPTVADGGTINVGATDVNSDPTANILVRTWGGLTISSGGSLLFKPASTTASRTVLVAASLSNGGKIDLANNDLIIHNGNAGSVTTSGSIANQIARGFDGGKQDGAVGILSSNASIGGLHALGYAAGGSTFDGVTTTSTDILVKYTYFGDANLDGKVDASDYSRIDSGFVTHATGWSNGDFNYDGVVNGSDYTLIDNAFNRQGASISSEFASPSATPTAEIAGPGIAAVPEPTSLTLLAMGTTGVLGRRRSRRRAR